MSGADFSPAVPPNDDRPAAVVAREALRAADDQARALRWNAALHHREVAGAWATLAQAEAMERMARVLERIDDPWDGS